MKNSWTPTGPAAALENLSSHVDSLAALHASIPRTTRQQAVELKVDVNLMQQCTELKVQSIKQIDKDFKKKNLLAAERKEAIMTSTLPANFKDGDNITELAKRHGIVHDHMTSSEMGTAYKSLFR